VDPVVDPMTGTQAFRATFDNADRLLVPGQFVARPPQRHRARERDRDSERAWSDDGPPVVMIVAANDSTFARDITVDQTLEAKSW